MLKRVTLAAALLALVTSLPAQTPGGNPQKPTQTQTQAPAENAPAVAKRRAPRPAAEQAPGGGPDKVWVNTTSSVYHCFGDRYYGRTAHGRYMTEAQAKAAGAKGPHGKPCPAGK